MLSLRDMMQHATCKPLLRCRRDCARRRAQLGDQRAGGGGGQRPDWTPMRSVFDALPVPEAVALHAKVMASGRAALEEQSQRYQGEPPQRLYSSRAMNPCIGRNPFPLPDHLVASLLPARWRRISRLRLCSSLRFRSRPPARECSQG